MKGQKAKILKLLSQGESETVEFKKSFGREAIETLCAFANTNGGKILIGVNDRGVVEGVQIGRHSLKEWADQIAQVTGGLHPSIHAFQIKGMTIVSIEIHESRIKPVMTHGKAYKRSGCTTRQMGLEELTRTALASIGITWDEIPEIRARQEDISISQVKAFVELANQKGRRPVPEKISASELLNKLGLIKEGKPTRAAILLFGKNPQQFYGQALLKIGRFRNETLIVDDRRVGGSLFDQVEGAMSYFREKLETRFEMTGRPQRDVIWEYPLEALREAVTNAICHRDYLSVRDTEVRIYDQELVVWNAGDLPRELSVHDLKKKHSSIPRNRQIAEIFFYAGFIEQWGSGIEKIMGECSKAGMPDPVFEEIQGFRVTFKKTSDGSPDKYRTSTGQVPDKYRITNRQTLDYKKLLAYCQKPKSVRQMMSYMRIKHRETFMIRYLNPLLKKRFLVRTDPRSVRSPKQRYQAA